MEELSSHFNISMKENQSASEPNLHVIIIVVLILVILLVLVTIILLKFMIKLLNKWRERRAEKALTRAMKIYNSQEPLKEPDCVHITPGDHNARLNTEGHGRQSEIAFVHLDGRIERFRLLANNSIRQESLNTRKQDCNKPRAQPHLLGPHTHRAVEDEEAYANFNLHGPHTHRASEDEEAYANFQPTCANRESIPTLCLGIADHEDTVSLRGYDIPPSYEQALEMPVVARGVLGKNVMSLNEGDELEQAYCNVQIGK